MGKRKIAMFFLGPFPKGNVSTIRIISYCKELVKTNNEVIVYLLAPTNEAKINAHKVGEFEGIKYKYLSKITWNKVNVSIFNKIYYYFLGLFLGLRELRNNRFDYVFTYHFNPFFNIIYSIYLRNRGIKFVLDKTEYPKGFQRANFIQKCFIKFNLKRFDKILTISFELTKFYGNIIGNENVFHLPMSVSPSRFFGLKRNFDVVDYIGVVFGVHNRDNIKDCILAFLEYCKNCRYDNQLELHLIGDFDKLLKLNTNLEFLRELIAKNERIKLVGIMDNEDIPQYLINSYCLMSSPLEFISGGFPTKLGEYLLSSRPVIITDVGEISYYLKDNIHGLLCNPGDLKALASKIEKLRLNSFNAEKIGANGKNLALSAFNSKYYINDLINFLKK